MKKVKRTIILILMMQCVMAQKQELGKVTIEELQQMQHPTDTSAVAAVLFNKGFSYFEYVQGEGFKIVTEIEVKIKVYKKEGFDYGNYGVSFYKTSTAEQLVSFSKAVTYNLENGFIVKSKLKAENEFKEVLSETRAIRRITMPNVKVGSIIEYKYTIRSPAGYITSMPEWNFQKDIPVAYSSYTVRIPQYYTYNKFLKGFLKVKESTSSSSNSLILNYKNLSTTDASRGYQTASETVNYTEAESKFEISDVPALKVEGYVSNIDNYSASIQYELAKSEFPGSLTELYATTWEAVSKKIYEDDDFGAQLNKVNYFEEDLKTILQNLSNESQKAIAIFNYVKNRMSWDKTNSYYCQKGVKKAYQDQSGNVAEINLILTAMLRAAGLDSNPILLSTRSNGIAMYPSRTAYNYVISSINLGDDNIVLLDATNKYSTPDLLPSRDLNWFGRMILRDGSNKDIDMSLKVISKDEVKLYVKIEGTGIVKGRIREQFNDYNAFLFRDNYSSISKDNYLENLEKRTGIEVENYERFNEDNLEKPLLESYDIKIKDASEIIGNKIFFSPLFHLAKKTNPFTQETREYPIDFTYPYEDKFIIVIQIPDGYVVESTPKDESFTLDNNMGSFSYKMSTVENQIQVLIAFNINTAIIAASDYLNLKQFYKNCIAKENEKIVLKKI